MESIIRSVGEWGIACRKRKSKSQHPTSQKAQSKSAAAGCCWRRRHSIGSLSLLDIAFCPFADEFLVKTMSIYARAGAHTTPRHIDGEDDDDLCTEHTWQKSKAPVFLYFLILSFNSMCAHWRFIVGYNVTFDRPPCRQREPTSSDNSHRAFKSEPLASYLIFVEGQLDDSQTRFFLWRTSRPNGIFNFFKTKPLMRLLLPPPLHHSLTHSIQTCAHSILFILLSLDISVCPTACSVGETHTCTPPSFL